MSWWHRTWNLVHCSDTFILLWLNPCWHASFQSGYQQYFPCSSHTWMTIHSLLCLHQQKFSYLNRDYSNSKPLHGFLMTSINAYLCPLRFRRVHSSVAYWALAVMNHHDIAYFCDQNSLWLKYPAVCPLANWMVIYLNSVKHSCWLIEDTDYPDCY